MALSIDITPSLGHSLLTTQLGVGVNPGYDSVDLRRVAAVGVQEGVHQAGGWKVTEHSPNNMSVNIAANIGLATISGDAVTNQGKYVAAPHSAVANLTFNSSNATNPRIDQVVLRAYDTTFDGLGFNKATLEVLTGTPTNGATLDNPDGAATLPGGTLRLADVLIPANSTAVVNSRIRDRRKWATGACWRSKKTDGATRRTSTTPWTIDSTNLQVRLECSGYMMLFTLVASANDFTPGAGWTGLFNNWNTIEGMGKGMTFVPKGGGNAGWSYMFAPSAGSHLFAPTYCGANGTDPLELQADADRPIIFGVRELLMGSSADNSPSS